MHHATLLTLSLCAALAVAQDPPRTEPQDPPRVGTERQDPTRQDQDHKYSNASYDMVPRRHAPLSEVLGAKVKLRPDAKERAEAASENRAPEASYGSIDDLIIDARSGEATWAVVSVGGLLGIGDKLVAVPHSALSCTHDPQAKACMFELGATEAQLKALPAFDKSTLQRTDTAPALRFAEESWRGIQATGGATAADANANRDRRPIGSDKEVVRDAKDASRDAVGAAKAPALKFASYPQVATVLASQISGMPVHCSDSADGKSFGSVDSACVDTDACRIAYIVVQTGGVLGVGETEYLVPLQATRVVRVGDSTKPALAIAKTSTEMANAPKYTKPASGFVDKTLCTTSCEFYGIDCSAKSNEMKPNDVNRPVNPTPNPNPNPHK